MKKHFLNVFVALLFSSLFIFSSCNSSSPSSDGELGFTIPASLVKSIAKKSRAGGDLNGLPGFDIDMKFVVSLKGDGGTSKSETKTLFKALVSGDYNDEAGTIDFKFTDLIVSETYSINVKAYLTYDGGELLAYEGSAENIKISVGENKLVKITLKGTDEYSDYYDSLSTYIVLYNNINGDNDEKFDIYAFPKDFLTSGSQAAPVLTAENVDNFVDFMIAEDNTLYWTDGYDIYTNYSDTPLTIDYGDSMYGVDAEDVKLYVDDDGLIFIGGYKDSGFTIGVYDTNQNKFFNAAKVNLEGALNPSGTIKNCFDFATNVELVQSDDPDTIEYDGYLYISFSFSNNNTDYIAFAQVPMTVMTHKNEHGIPYDDIYVYDYAEGNAPNPINLISFYDVAYSNGTNEFAASLTKDAAITDMIYHNGDLYALLREMKITDSQIYGAPMELTYTSYARGALVKINNPEIEGNFKSSSVQLLGDSSCNTPWTFNNGQEEDSRRTWKFYQPSKNGSFYGPQKFIGIRPNELIIADDGLFFWEENGTYKFKNINYAIIYNERTNQADEHSISSSLPIFFNEEIEEDILFTSQLDTADNPVSELTFVKTE